MLFYDAIDCGEPKARPLTDFLGGEEGVENIGPRRFIHATAGIRNRDECICPGPVDTDSLGRVRIEFDAFRC